MRESDFRVAGEEDSPDPAAVVNAAYEPAEHLFVDGPRITIDEVREKLRHGAFLVDGARPMRGLVCVAVLGDLGFFGPLAVAPGQQGTGLGRRLVEAAERYCRAAGCRAIAIDVVNHRRVLLDFYGRRGYVVTGRRPFPDIPVKMPTHFVVMRKTLAPAT